MKAEMQETGVLTAILEETQQRIHDELPMLAEWQRLAEQAAPAPPFARAFTAPDVAIIAEAKRRSPSKGAIAESSTALALAQAYAAGYAAAISVLTEPLRFGGSLGDLAEISRGTSLPTLRKDFILDPVQVYQSRASGASAILLIVRALTEKKLAELAALAHALGLATLVEVHSAGEMAAAIACGPTAIGINARDLETLEMFPLRHEALLPRIPAGIIAVAESGLATRADVARVASYGADAVLVGTAVASARQPAEAVKALIGVRKTGR